MKPSIQAILPSVCIALATTGGAQELGELRRERITEEPAACPEMLRPGERIRLSGGEFQPKSKVEITLSSVDNQMQVVKANLGTFEADSSGNLEAIVAIPSGTLVPTLGEFWASGTHESGEKYFASNQLNVIAIPSSEDRDQDGISDDCDNCPDVAAADQKNSDGDRLGDACDPCPRDRENDADEDGLCANATANPDPCPYDPENDQDGDGLCEEEDNCPSVSNPIQEDSDRNGIGDACQTFASCGDGVDNDEDGLIDLRDPGCRGVATNSEEKWVLLPCDNGLDDDHDGLIDFVAGRVGDPGCESPSSPIENPECNDNEDNDGDGAADSDGGRGLVVDAACFGRSWHDSEADLTGPDEDGDGLLDSVDPCRSYRNRAPWDPTDLEQDTNNDGIPNECQCGDGDEDGLITESDLRILSDCAKGVGFCSADSLDTDGDQRATEADVEALRQVLEGKLEPWRLQCFVRKEGSAPPSNP